MAHGRHRTRDWEGGEKGGETTRPGDPADPPSEGLRQVNTGPDAESPLESHWRIFPHFRTSGPLLLLLRANLWVVMDIGQGLLLDPLQAAFVGVILAMSSTAVVSEGACSS